MMAAEGYVPLYLSPYIEANRMDYHAALKSAQQQLDWNAIIGFAASAVTGTVNELMITRDALTRLRRAWQERGKFRSNSAALNALDVVPHYPVLTINRLKQVLGVSFPAARTAINHLTSLGILEERTGYQRNRIFASREALAIINRPFGAEPNLPADVDEVQG